MSRELDIVSWNVCDAINSRQVQSAITNADFDIGVFPEAASERDEVHVSTKIAFENAGYSVYAAPYSDIDGRKDRHTLAVIAKPELVDRVDKLSLAGRTAIRLQLVDGTDFTGLHLDDRTEFMRIQQVLSLLEQSPLAIDAIVAGDFNAMYADNYMAAVLRGLQKPAELLPSKDPGEETTKLRRAGSLAQRLTAMADGTTMRILIDAGFIDADPDHQPTMCKGPLRVQLDHIMHRGTVRTIRQTIVESADGLSDHGRLRATLESQ